MGKPKGRNNPLRASIRLNQKLKQALGDAARAKKSQSLRISRTVELVNQTNDLWRQDKSKLIFMLALGLTPIANKPAVVMPTINIFPLAPEVLQKLRHKEMEMKAAQLARMKESRRIERLRRADKLRRMKSSSNLPGHPIEVINLSSDDEDDIEVDCQEELAILPDEEGQEPVFILSDYPNLRMTLSSTPTPPRSPSPLIKHCVCMFCCTSEYHPEQICGNDVSH